MSQPEQEQVPDDCPNYFWRMRMLDRISTLESRIKQQSHAMDVLSIENMDLKERLGSAESRLDRASRKFTELCRRIEAIAVPEENLN